MNKIIIFIFCLIFGSCTVKETNTEESPLSSVIKLISAESLNDVNEAKKYINIERAYSKYADDKLDAVSLWRQHLAFQSSNNSIKHTNQFKYYQFNIQEKIDVSKALVSFTSKNREAKIKQIVYTLELSDRKWLVIGIEYIKD